MTKKTKIIIIIAAVIVVAVAVLIIEYSQERQAQQEQPDQNKMEPKRYTGGLRCDDYKPPLPEWLEWAEGTGMTFDDIIPMISELAGVSDGEILRRIESWERVLPGSIDPFFPLPGWASAAGVAMSDVIHMMSERSGVSENVIIDYLFIRNNDKEN